MRRTLLVAAVIGAMASVVLPPTAGSSQRSYAAGHFLFSLDGEPLAASVKGLVWYTEVADRVDAFCILVLGVDAPEPTSDFRAQSRCPQQGVHVPLGRTLTGDLIGHGTFAAGAGAAVEAIIKDTTGHAFQRPTIDLAAHEPERTASVSCTLQRHESRSCELVLKVDTMGPGPARTRISATMQVIILPA